MKKTKYILPILGESALKNAESFYKQNGYFSDTILQELHSIYNGSLEKAMQILDKSKVIQYYSTSSDRLLYAVGIREKQLKLFESINFCFCETFRRDILETASLVMCEHVLALKLVEITGGFVKEEMNELHFIELLKMMSEAI